MGRRLRWLKTRVLDNAAIGQALAVPLGLSIGIANWTKDFAQNSYIVAPSFYSNIYTTGETWYAIALATELLAVLGFVLFSRRRRQTAYLALVYGAFSGLNTYFYILRVSNRLSVFWYGILWNDVFNYAQIPLLILIGFSYFGIMGKVWRFLKRKI